MRTSSGPSPGMSTMLSWVSVCQIESVPNVRYTRAPMPSASKNEVPLL